MTTDPQHLLSAPIPFYRRRWFWGMVIGVQILVSTIIVAPLVPQIHSALLIVTGGWIFMWAATIPNTPEYTHLVVQLLFLAIFCFATFRKKAVSLPYPIIYLITSILSTYVSYIFLT